MHDPAVEDQPLAQPLEPPAWQYVAAFVVYVALGLVFMVGVLNWIVGPLFLVVALDVVPRAFGRGYRAGR